MCKYKKIRNKTHTNMQFAKKAYTNNIQKLTETDHLHRNILLLYHASNKNMKQNTCIHAMLKKKQA